MCVQGRGVGCGGGESRVSILEDRHERSSYRKGIL